MLLDELQHLLALRNGFYALEGAVHLLPAAPSGLTLSFWNASETWRFAYEELTDGYFFFAQDVFGNPFALHQTGVVLFDAETGATELVAPTVAGWAEAVISNDYWSGWSLAQAWQSQYGSLLQDHRLVPTQPFVLGGAFDMGNLKAVPAVEGMRFRGHLATQLRDLPNGAKIQLTIT
ncbi:hypothetical protein DAETH_26750 [Deinococcus aetherius]|uniref:T6SS immunity protein Tdi1 C-terminal domain-containing protein n=1 Tax=Deinococcus aetherius TaxID=200252 RepID=A0ABM8AG84_9DEIO|nr:SMI1/KNR4 family protein [Deinococcus aetherius]BDP42706.1 hypothetical protein DAETH_26750 [Deinococcus aetherius]